MPYLGHSDVSVKLCICHTRAVFNVSEFAMGHNGEEVKRGYACQMTNGLPGEDSFLEGLLFFDEQFIFRRVDYYALSQTCAFVVTDYACIHGFP